MPGRKPPRRGETGNGFMAPPRRGVERRRRTSPSSTTAASVVRSLAACARAWASNSSRMSTVAFTINHRTTHFAEAHAVAQGVFSIPTSATTKFVDEQGEGASPAGACVSRPAASAAAATPTAHAAGIAARVPTRIRLRARPPRGGSPGVCPRTRGSCPTIPVPRRRAAGGRGPPAYGSRTVRPQARRSCASDSTPGAGYRRVPGPAGGLERGRRLTGRGESPAPADRVVSLSPSCRAAAGTVSRATVSDSTPTAGGEDGGQVRRPEKSPPGLDRRAARATRPRRLRRPPCCDGRRAVRPARVRIALGLPCESRRFRFAARRPSPANLGDPAPRPPVMARVRATVTRRPWRPNI